MLNKHENRPNLQKVATPRAAGDEHGEKNKKTSKRSGVRIDIAPHTRPVSGGVSSLHSGIEFGRRRTGEGLRGGGRRGWCEEWARSG